jgi:hypothetical protein
MNAIEKEANQLKEDDDRSRDARAKRARELQQIFHGIPALVSSPNSGIVLADVNQCWVTGAFVACILTADSHVENNFVHTRRVLAFSQLLGLVTLLCYGNVKRSVLSPMQLGRG